MKFLIGIMYCIENELDQCIKAIENQTHQNFEYFIIKNLPNKEAHEKLYGNFMSRAEEFDYFIKVDADMVLTRTTCLEEISKYLEENPDIDDLSLAVHDYFTDQLIQGMHVYKKTVRWNLSTKENIFVDIIDNCKNKKTLWTGTLIPIANHCPNPSIFQSFHYGLHKAVKVMQINNEEVNDRWARNHFANVLLLEKMHLNEPENILRSATILGALKAFSTKATWNEVDFRSEKINKLFNEINFKNISNVNKIIRKEKGKSLFFSKQIAFNWILLKSNPKLFLKVQIMSTIKNIKNFPAR